MIERVRRHPNLGTKEAEDCVTRWREEGARVTFKELELSHEDFGVRVTRDGNCEKTVTRVGLGRQSERVFFCLFGENAKAAEVRGRLKGSSKSSKLSKRQDGEEEDLPKMPC